MTSNVRPQKRFISLTKIKRRLKYAYRRYVLKDVFKAEVRRWQEDDGDNIYRLSYDLNERSVVFDLGGYLGDFASSIYNKYGCSIYLFEPSKAFFDKCVTRFHGNAAVKMFNFGLSNTTGEFTLSDEGDASSLGNGVLAGERVAVKSFAEVFANLPVDEIDLLKINIEGGEYDVIPHLIENGLIAKVRHLQVQFHNFIPGAEQKRSEIEKALLRTHKREWCYTFVWESWSRR
ncbi:FkbM family methyltransferase [Agrobacterium rosae]|uniref:FkbM family methyltransferase n=1 Tax=Agrobacterium rosae TaxID=1972867 RepID=UPI002A1457B7|nr:FkbM family methyltransferase [Agrobacterium rosae]MDX8315852.1 FkbM family methyltransferase [Agrobacterium rosae]